MNGLSQVSSCLMKTLEIMGLYEPELTVEQAKEKLSREKEIWQQCQMDRDKTWIDFQKNNQVHTRLPFQVIRALKHLNQQGVQKGVAVDLGCGINSTTFFLLEHGWKVYAVDSSKSVIDDLTHKVLLLQKKWIEEGKLVLVNEKIEKFQYPEKIDLINAAESLPYCDPTEMIQIFLRAKNALHEERGIIVGSFFPYSTNPRINMLMRQIFGSWMTKKNVIEAFMRSVDFPKCSVEKGPSPNGLTTEFYVFAEMKKEVNTK
jgi:SAM-dependent methyltransferase